MLIPSAVVPTSTETSYDVAGRVTAAILKGDGAELYRTSYAYDGIDQLRGEPAVFGLVASDPTVSRLVDTLAADAPQAMKAIDVARAAAFATRYPGYQAAPLKVLGALVTETKLRALTAGAS